MSVTPGPWTNSARHIDAPNAGRFGKRICDLVTNDDDARLIAAAPDLLAALTAAFSTSLHDEGDCTTPWHGLAKYALAKAQGEIR